MTPDGVADRPYGPHIIHNRGVATECTRPIVRTPSADAYTAAAVYVAGVIDGAPMTRGTASHRTHVGRGEVRT